MQECVVLNAGSGAWAFQELAINLSQLLNLEISDTPAKYNYVLSWEQELANLQSFIPFDSMKLASDKRLLAEVFNCNLIPTPETHLIDTFEAVVDLINNNRDEWCLKYPTGCGGSGHKIISCASDIPQKWLQPYVVQRFIRLDAPKVYRVYCAGETLFGWNVRQFPSGANKSPWVAHARGAVYEVLEHIPDEVINIATKTFRATGLFDSFGCADFIRDDDGKWLVLEIGTDGIFNYVDRTIGNKALEAEISENVARAFLSKLSCI